MNPTAAPTSGSIDGSRPGFLDAEAVAFYRERGYLVVENALSPEDVAEINDAAAQVCRGELGTFKGWQGPHDGQSDLEVFRQYLCIHFPHKISPV
ncbi:MAG: phytanoyl-CoA dioxygenase family protein, partial [Planctomycetota bacterium]